MDYMFPLEISGNKKPNLSLTMHNIHFKDKLEEEGMEVYQYIVDNFETCEDKMPELIERLHKVDITGQFFSSSAIFLSAVDRPKYEKWLAPLIDGAIEKDREHKYLSSLLTSIWGEDYESRADELKDTDNNFRRVYKRIHPDPNLL